MLTRYQPSGRIGLAACFVLGPLVLVLIGLSYPYRWLLGQTASFMVILSLFVGFGAVVFGACYLASRIGKTRSRAMGLLTGGLAAMLVVAGMHYWQYQIATAGLPARPSFRLYLHDKAKTGWYVSKTGIKAKKRGTLHSGAWVYTIWSIEALALVAAGAWAGRASAGRPFCESCDRWAVKKIREITAYTPAGPAKARLDSATTMREVLDPELPEEGATEDELVYTICDCPGCAEMPTLTVAVTEVKYKRKKRDATTTKVFIDLLMTPEDLLDFEDLDARVAAVHGHT